MNIKNRKEILFVTAIIIIQTVVFVILGFNKSYIHMDEAFSLGLSNYHSIKIQNNEDFYNNWHNGDYYKDYLVVNTDEKMDFSPVYVNQKNDVHPPLYYLLLRIAMNFNIDNFSVWPGIIINIIIYAGITFFVYLIFKKLFEGKNNVIEKSAILALMSSLVLSSLTNVIYIRMYALSTLNIAITTFLHLKLLDEKVASKKTLVYIGISALTGSLTHYYYLFYLAMLAIMFVIKYIKEKEFVELKKYILTMVMAGIISIIIFPYSINHMFFGYRGQGSISKLENISKFLESIFKYISKVDVYVFNNCLVPILVLIFILLIKKKIEKNKYLKYIAIPSLFYFILVAISSPWVELRYIMPICQMIFALIMVILVNGLSNCFKEKTVNFIVVGILIFIIIMPSISNHVFKLMGMNYKIKNEVLYFDKREIVNQIEEKYNVATIYLINPSRNRFLDDILWFSKINKSYIALDKEYNSEKIEEIMKEEDISNGIVVFISDGQDKKALTKMIRETLKLNEVEHLLRMNACDIYYIK